MAFRGFFFDSLLNSEGKHDRLYSANDYSNLLKFVIGNGVVHLSDKTLQVVNDTDTLNREYDKGATTFGLKIKAGCGWINGKAFENSADYEQDITVIKPDGTTEVRSITSLAMPTIGNRRIDRVIVRRDDSPAVRDILPYILQGVESMDPEPISIEDTFAGNINGNVDGKIADICIAEIEIDNTGDRPYTYITDTIFNRKLCGYVNCWFGDDYQYYCNNLEKTVNDRLSEYIDRTNNLMKNQSTNFNSWFNETRDTLATVTMIKRLTSTQTATTGQTFSINIAEYDPSLDLLYVYTNGIFENHSDYTISADGKTITFNTPKLAGTIIDFVVEKARDGRWYADDGTSGTKISSVESDITEIFEKLEAQNSHTYVCNGVDDNVKISNIVKEFLTANRTDNARLKLNIVGTFGATAPAMEQISTDVNNPEEHTRWFDFGTSTSRRFILDFSNCSPITLPITNNTNNVIFYGSNQEIEKCVLKAGKFTDTGTQILATYGKGDVVHKDCKYGFICDNSCFLTRHGRFDNCQVTVISKTNNAVAFYTDPTSCVCEVNGGIYWLYTGAGVSSNYSTKLVFHSQTTNMTAPTYTATTLLNNVSVPTTALDTLLTDGVSLKQDGVIVRINSGAKGYVRSTNLITTSDRMENNYFGDGNVAGLDDYIPYSRAKAQEPFI